MVALFDITEYFMGRIFSWEEYFKNKTSLHNKSRTLNEEKVARKKVSQVALKVARL